MALPKSGRSVQQLSAWLEADRKAKAAKKPGASDSDLRVARSEAADLWDAIVTEDRTGNLMGDVRAKYAAGDMNFKNAFENGISRAAVSDIAAAEFDYAPGVVSRK